MSEPAPPDRAEKATPPFRSFLLWHAVLDKPSPPDLDQEKRRTDWQAEYDALMALWNALADDKGLSLTAAGRPDVCLDFPDRRDLEKQEGYAWLAFRRQPTMPHHDFAYVYVEHDVVGVVVLLHSTEPDDFATLRAKLPSGCDRVPALWRFETRGMIADHPAVPTTLKEAVYADEDFRTEQGFTLWNLRPEKEGVARLLTAVPNDERKQDEFQQSFLGPDRHICPPLLEYQVHSAKVRHMVTRYNAQYGPGAEKNLRRRRQGVDEDIDRLLESGAAETPTLLLQQQKEGGLTLMHRDLKAWLITLQVAVHHLKRLQPRAADGEAGNAARATFDLYQHDRDLAQELRSAIETEMGYIEATTDRLRALQTVYSARLEQDRLNTEADRLKTETARLEIEKKRQAAEEAAEKDKSYQNLVQGSILSGIGLGLAAIQASAEYQVP